MTKIFTVAVLVLSMLFVLISCTKEIPDSAKETQEEGDWTSEFYDHHNARNSLDYHGTYTGVIPSASGEGIETTVILLENYVFFRKTVYLGENNNNGVEEAGGFYWNEAGNIITLQAIDNETSYFVGENVLYHLDQEGKRIEGDLAEHYKLRKVD